MTDQEPDSQSGYPSLRTLEQLVVANPVLNGLLERIRQHEALTTRIREQLPAELAPHLCAALLHNDKLVLQTTSSVWASRLRFAASGLRSNFPEVKVIRIAVLPQTQAVPLPAPKPKQKRTLSPHNADLLQTLATSLADPTLVAALLRLAAHTR